MTAPRGVGAAATRLRRAEGILSRRVLDELLVATPRGDVILLSGSAAHVWRALEDHPEVGDLVAHLSTTFDAPSHVVATDVGALVDALLAHGLLLEDTPGGAGP